MRRAFSGTGHSRAGPPQGPATHDRAGPAETAVASAPPRPPAILCQARGFPRNGDPTRNPARRRTRGRLHLSRPIHCASDGDEGFEGCEGFPDAERNAAETFDTVEKAFDQVAFLADHPVDGAASRAASVALDLRLGLHRIGDEVPQRLGVMAGLRHDMAGALKPGDRPFGLRAVGPLARG